MGESTKIEWCDHTFNPWWGCVEISPACDHCYARELAKRFDKARWGKHEERVRTSPANWREPLKWDAKARKEGRRVKVFCGSMMDVGEDNPQLDPIRADLWELMDQTTNTDWLLLTKRPGNLARIIYDDKVWDLFERMVWAGVTAENREAVDKRVPKLIKIPAVKRFLSCEPLIEPIFILNGKAQRWSFPTRIDDSGRGIEWTDLGDDFCPIDWVIVGGESGHNARPMNIEWARSLRDQCKRAGVPLFVKQWGEYNEHGERVGKHESGALLDGVEYKEFPC